MSHEITTLQGLLDALPADTDVPLIFTTDQGEISAGYHVTEFRLARIDAIDCGRGQSSWTEGHVQLLDGSQMASEHMNVGKFRQIAQQSIRALPGLGAATLVVEFAPGNAAFSRFSPASVASSQGAIYIDLQAHHAVCKPAVRHSDMPGSVGTIATSACCQSAASRSTACCS